MTDALRRLLRWIFFGEPEPLPPVDWDKHDRIIRRMQRDTKRLRDPVTRRYAGRGIHDHETDGEA